MMIETGQLLERYRHLSRDIQNGLQTAQKHLASLKEAQDPALIDKLTFTLSHISESWQDFSGWMLISTLDDLDDARRNCAPGRVDLLSKIKRAKMKFTNDSIGKGLTVDISRTESTVVETYIPYFEQVFDLIFANAVKYSQKAGAIVIEMTRGNHEHKITVHSIGPIVQKHEVQRLGDTGFRSENAKKLEVTGQGYGLYNAKRLAALLDMKIYFRPEQKVLFSSGDVSYANFIVELVIPETPTPRNLKGPGSQ